MGIKKGRIIDSGQIAFAFDMIGSFLGSHDRWRIKITVGYTRENRAVSVIKIFCIYHTAIGRKDRHLICFGA